MNLWVPHEAMSRTEAEIVSRVANWFISTKTSGPVNGEVQDANVGSFEMTRAGVEMDKFHAMGLHQATRMDPPTFEGDASTRFTGREVVSRLFERHAPVNYARRPQWYNENYAPFISYHPDETMTVMKHGRLVSGVLDRRSVGAGAVGGIFHLISREYGSKLALDMIYALQQMALEFLGNRGFTIGTGDFLLSDESTGHIREIISGLQRESEMVTDRLLRGDIVPPIGMTTHEFYERLQIEALKTPDDILGPILRDIVPDSNGLFKMIATKSKGGPNNMIHIMGMIGQVTINSARIQEQFAFRRTLPYFPRFATSAKAYGFVANNYINGMTSSEFIFSDMNGRFDLINKALSTASTGYQMRKSIMSLQSIIVDNFRAATKGGRGAVRVVQFVYGEDGLDARQVEAVTFRTTSLSDAALREQFFFDAEDVYGKEAHGGVEVFSDEFAKITEDRDTFRKIFMRFEYMNFNRPMKKTLPMPVNIVRIIENARTADGPEAAEAPTPLPDLLVMYDRVLELCRVLPYAFINEIQERRRTPVPVHLGAATSLLCMLVRAELCTRVLVGLTPDQLTYVIDMIRQQYARSLVDYGTAAGVLAAQAVSEPLTQYMLDSHHRSVSGATNKAGLIRVEELFQAKKIKDERSSEMLLHPVPEIAHDRAAVQQVANSVELLTFGRFVRSYEILYEPYGVHEGSAWPPLADDREWVVEFERAHPLIKRPADLTNWCVWFELDRASMIYKSIDLELIVEHLRTRHPNAYVLHTPENVSRIRVRIYVQAAQFRRGAETEEKRVEEFRAALLDTVVRGVRGIVTAEVVTVIRHRIEDDGSLVREDRSLFAVKTTGTNLYGALMNQQINPRTVTSSSVGDTFKILGIEAARYKLISEVRTLMGDGAPNLRHIMIYADEMTRLGRVVSLERGGLKIREAENILLRMAMSAPLQVLTEAATNALRTYVTGISAPILLGGIPKIGTLYNDFVMDEDFIAENVRSVDRVLDEI